MRKGIEGIGLVVVLLAAAAVPPAAAGPEDEPGSRPEMITPAVEQSIERGLAYLARTQLDNGSWTSGGTAGWSGYPTTMTALAGMAMLGAGQTPTRGRYATSVRKAMMFLLRSQTRTGLITAESADESRPMYGHGFATMFLAEVYGMEEDPQRREEIARVLRVAVELTARSQSEWGGWLYTPDSGGDEGSVTVTQIQALRAARNAGIGVPLETIRKAVEYIDKSANGDGGIRYQARGGGPSRPALTAAAVATLYNAGEYDHPVAQRAIAYCRRQMGPDSGNNFRYMGGHVMYTHVYLAQAMYLSGDENWRFYFPGARDWLVSNQAAEGSWNVEIGPVFSTALALTILQLPHEQVPIYQR